MILFLQIIAILFSFAMVYFAVLHYKRGELDGNEIMSWLVIWTVVILIILFPDIIRTFSQKVLLTRLFDLVIVGGFVLVIFMVTRAYLSTKRIEKKLEKYIRQEALKNVKKKNKK